ncbi:hypothetical protein ACXR0O_13970 [Verrucomicrobiota bacterium sgz303538]
MLKIDESQFREDLVLIRNVPVKVRVGLIDHRKLKFYIENPRVYSLLWDGDGAPTQEEIESQMIEMEHVIELRQDIVRMGGLIEPLTVKMSTAEVIEGNSRLAAYRLLAKQKQDPKKWTMVRCQIFETDDESLISAVLGQWHLKGKKQWVPYEQAGFLYRRFHQNFQDYTSLAEEVGMSVPLVKNYIKAYELMVQNDDRRQSRWSYYFEYVKSNKIRRAREECPALETRVLSMIKNDNFKRAEDVRDKLPVICEDPKIVQKFTKGSLTFDDAAEKAMESAESNDLPKRLEKFHQWLTSDDTVVKVAHSSGEAAGQVRFELKRIAAAVEKLNKKLPS